MNRAGLHEQMWLLQSKVTLLIPGQIPPPPPPGGKRHVLDRVLYPPSQNVVHDDHAEKSLQTEIRNARKIRKRILALPGYFYILRLDWNQSILAWGFTLVAFI